METGVYCWSAKTRGGRRPHGVSPNFLRCHWYVLLRKILLKDASLGLLDASLAETITQDCLTPSTGMNQPTLSRVLCAHGVRLHATSMRPKRPCGDRMEVAWHINDASARVRSSVFR